MTLNVGDMQEEGKIQLAISIFVSQSKFLLGHGSECSNEG